MSNYRQRWRQSWSARALLFLWLLAQCAVPTTSWALPEGAVIKGGQGTLNYATVNHLDINQLTQRLAVDFQSFDIARHESVNINQPGSLAVFSRSNYRRCANTDPWQSQCPGAGFSGQSTGCVFWC